MRSRARSAQHGFTLMEVAVTLIIASVMVSIAVPSMRELILNSRVKQASSDMLATLAYARNEAINRNAQVSVVATGSWSSGWQVVANGTPLRQTTLNGDVTVTASGGSVVTYNPNGRLASGTSASFAFSIPANAKVAMRCVAVGLVGQPTPQVDANRDGDCTNG